MVAATESAASELAWRKSNVRVAVLCPSYVASNVAQTTARMASELSTDKQAERPILDKNTVAEITAELQGLSRLIERGMAPDEVAELTLSGLAAGRRYIYTDATHTEAAINDRVEQLRAGGLPHDFERRMEHVVETALGGTTK